MERKTFYRLLLAVVLVLTFIYTLGLIGVVPFEMSYYITLFMVMLFIYLRFDAKARGD